MNFIGRFRKLGLLSCGLIMLQTTGCTVDTLLDTVINLTLTALLSSLLGTPL